jgi:hypothetical protein
VFQAFNNGFGETDFGLRGFRQFFVYEDGCTRARRRARRTALLRYQGYPFGDGNKRIGTLLFLEYLRRNGLLASADGSPRLADNAMVALALLIAESEAAQKELMIRLVLNLLGDKTA